MAAVLDALAPFVKNLVQDMAQKEVAKLLGVSGEITQLGSTMEKITEWVSDAESKRITDRKVQEWVNKLKDAMYDGTDILELCQLEAEERSELEEGLGEGGNREQNLLACFQPLQVWLQNPVVTLITCGGVAKMKAFFQSFLFCLRNPVFADEIGSRIKELNQRLEGINKEAENNFKFQRYLHSSNPEPRKVTAAESSRYKQTTSLVNESAIVGEQIENDTKELVQVLTTDDNKNQDLKVVSIIGTGGMGKTTLAQKIFNDETIKENFQTKIWLSVTKHFDEAELLRTAIKHAGGDHGGEKDKSTLSSTLIGTLSTKGRFLLVMDDVWAGDHEAWRDVLGDPVGIAAKEQPGSRVLVTTRDVELPLQMQADLHQHRVKPLKEEDAWSLLKTRLRPDQVDGIDKLKSIGMEILEKCDGLPFAIKLIGALLSRKDRTVVAWKSVLNKLAWSRNGLPPELDNRLYLSYQDLSPSLKQCFLYCSLFPKGTLLIQDMVAAMWISEGFIQTQDGTSFVSHDQYELEEKAIENYQEMVKRNLIEPIQEDFSGTRCIMNDVVRSFAEYMAREESLVVDGRQQAANCDGIGAEVHVRRLSVLQTVSIVGWKILERRQSLRTLLILSRANFLLPGDSLGSFSSLRVLYVCGADIDTLATSLSMLKHLRYLHLECTDISRLPEDIHKIKLLQYISLYSCEKLCYLPGSIIKLKHLSHFNMGRTNVSVVPKGFGRLTNLISIDGFPVNVDNGWCSLQELSSLSQLRVLDLCGLEKLNESQMAEKGILSRMGHLQHIEFTYGASEHTMQRSVVDEEVMENLCPPTCIEYMRLTGGYVGRRLPNWMHAPASSLFESLRELTLINLPCCTQLPDGLCCLPSLQFMEITDAPAIRSIGPEFQASSSSATATSAPFPELGYLIMQRLSAWEKWEWNHQDEEFAEAIIAMPRLRKLAILECKLSCLPPGLASSQRHALRELILDRVTNLTEVENFPSVVKLEVYTCLGLKRISDLPMLQEIKIVYCTKLEVLERVPALDRIFLEDRLMDTLPGYLQAVSPRYIDLICNMKIYESMMSGGSEADKINQECEYCNVRVLQD